MTFLSYKYQQTALWLMSILLNFCTPYYDNQYTFTITSGAVATNTAILHPNIFYIADSWSADNKYDFWNKNYIDVTVNNYEVKKTIYSPSPIGFSEPKTAAFTGFTSNGGNTTAVSQFNVSGGFNKGWNFYCQPKATGGTIFFSTLLGCRGESGTVGGVNYGTPYWTAGPSGTSTYARYADIYPNNVSPQNEYRRACGYILRPTSE